MKKILCTLFVMACIANLNAQVPSYVPTNGLVGYWPFNGNANDESGNGNNGTVNGATLTSDRNGNENSAYSFGGDDWIQFSHSSNLDFSITESYTLSCWILVDEDHTNGSIYEKWNDSSNTPYPYNLRIHDDEIASARYIGGFPQNQTTNQTVIADKNLLDTDLYNNIVTIYTPNEIFLYVNGSLVAQIANEMNEGGNTTNNSDITLGRRISSNNRFFKGNIDDFAIWDRALTEQEIANLYTSNSSNECSTLVINTGVSSTSPVTYTSTVNIYPNPANDQITIDCGNLDNVEGWHIKITNTLGQEVFNKPMDTQQYVIPLNTWTGQGMYFVKIINAENEVVNIKKIILQ